MFTECTRRRHLRPLFPGPEVDGHNPICSPAKTVIALPSQAISTMRAESPSPSATMKLEEWFLACGLGRFGSVRAATTEYLNSRRCVHQRRCSASAPTAGGRSIGFCGPTAARPSTSSPTSSGKGASRRCYAPSSAVARYGTRTKSVRAWWLTAPPDELISMVADPIASAAAGRLTHPEAQLAALGVIPTDLPAHRDAARPMANSLRMLMDPERVRKVRPAGLRSAAAGRPGAAPAVLRRRRATKSPATLLCDPEWWVCRPAVGQCPIEFFPVLDDRNRNPRRRRQPTRPLPNLIPRPPEGRRLVGILQDHLRPPSNRCTGTPYGRRAGSLVLAISPGASIRTLPAPGARWLYEPEAWWDRGGSRI